MTVRIEVLADGDVPVVAAIDEEAFPQTRPAEEHIREEMSRPWTRAWAAHGDAGVVGYLLSWHVADELHILQVATETRERRRGVGRALVERALAFAVAEKVRLVLLEVRRSNVAAIALYRGLGFSAVNVRRGYYANGEDAVEMLVELDPGGARVPRVDEVKLPS